MNGTSPRRDAAGAVPFPVRVAAALSWRLLAIAGALFLVGYVLIALRVVVIPVAIALLLTAALGPVVHWLAARRVPRGLAAAVVMIAGLAGIGGLLVFVIQAFVDGLPQLRAQINSSVEAIRGFLERGPFGLPPVGLDNLLNQISAAITSNQASITAGALSTAVGVGEFLTGLALTIFTLVIFLYGGGGIWQFLIKIVPASVRSRVDVAGQRSFASLVGYVRATLLVAVVDAVGIGIGLLAVGAPLVVPLTALVFLAAFIPVVGAVLSGAIAVLVVLVANGLIPALIVLAVVLGVQQLEGNVLQPLIMGRAVRLSALAVVLAVSVGAVLAGITGALLSVPLLAAVSSGVRSLLVDDDVDPAAVDQHAPSQAVPAAPASGGATDGDPGAADADRAGEQPAESEPRDR
ncbi:MAG: AI-2E family transporter [Pseudonocardiaceae bacterium]|nr:AI-2E family transporter [Pseudonocardiaceae bacterium]